MANLFELPRYIAVEGPIRVGKSTLARILAERLNAQQVMESEDNPFLGAFYKGEPGAGFQAQFAFLIRRFEQLRGLDLGARAQKTVVTDFVFEKDKVFACLNLNDQELETYNRYYNYFREQLPTPDLVIYLQATPEVLKKRLRKKNAPGEKAINEDYLEEVIKAYEPRKSISWSATRTCRSCCARSRHRSRGRNTSCHWEARKQPALNGSRLPSF